MGDKIVRDGKVAVLYSPGYGAGWSTWGDGISPFDPDMVRAVLGESDETPSEVHHRKYPDEYDGGVDDLVIQWVPEGTQFDILEYDGSESLVLGNRQYVA